MSRKPGRNDPCPCNSGKKFKKCHGLPALAKERSADHIRGQALDYPVPDLHAAREFQRKEQQGLGRPIISAQVQKQRVVAVGNRVYTSKNWKTFHDFLCDYPRLILGNDWWLEEVSKLPELQHSVVTWFMRAREQMAAMRETGRGQHGFPATGALSAFMRFAYDLYSLQHAVKVEPLLIDRIKSPRGFPGAMYEVRVAASLLRAGFTLEMEDETDRRSTHVEFVATHTATGAKFSVEAKRREGARLKINKLLHSALTKHAAFPRIVFIDTNDERLDFHCFEKLPIPLADTKKLLNLYTTDPIGSTLPVAYVIATFAPEEHHLDSTETPFSMLLWGFRVDDMQPGFKTLMEQVQTRRRHFPVFDLFSSMEKHRTIPMSFDGEADAFENSPSSERLQIGKRYVVPAPDGRGIEATLESGVVVLQQKQAACIFVDAGGMRFMGYIPLTDAELEAYKQHPSTFFGVLDPNAGRKSLSTPMDYFNFLWESAKDTPREALLEWLGESADIGELAALSQQDLATHYCVRMARVMLRNATIPQVSAAASNKDGF